MAITWGFNEPLPALQDFTVTPVAGGTIGAGTYDFRAIVCDTGENFRYGATRESPPIFVNDVSFDGTQGAQFDFTWDASHYAGQRVFVWYTSNSSWLGTNARCILNAGSYSNNWTENPNTTRTENTLSSSTYFSSVNSIGSIPLGLDNTLGTGIIDVSGNVGAGASLLQVFQNMQTQGLANTDLAYWNGYNYFAGFWSLRFVNGLEGTLETNYMKLWMPSLDLGYRVTDGRNYTAKFQGGPTDNSELSSFLYAGSAIYAQLYNCIFRNATLSSGTGNMSGGGMGSMQVGTNINTRFINSKVHGSYPRLDYLDTYAGSLLSVSQLLVVDVDSTDWIEPFTLSGVIRLQFSQHNEYFKDMKFYYSNGGYPIECRPQYDNTGHQTILCDCLFYEYDTDGIPTENPIDYPENIYWRYLINGFDYNMYVAHTLKMTIADNNGSKITGQSVIVYDSSDNVLNNETTDSSGNIDTWVKTRKVNSVGTSDGSGSSRLNIVDYFPIKIVIERDGYSPTNIIIDEFIEPKNMNIVLDKSGTKIYNSTIHNSNIY